MLSEKYENLLELYVKQLVIQSKFRKFVFLSQTMYDCEKPDVNVVCNKARYFRIKKFIQV